MSHSIRPLGDGDGPSLTPAAALGWAAIMATAAGIFYLTASGNAVRRNRKSRLRRSSRLRRNLSRNIEKGGRLRSPAREHSDPKVIKMRAGVEGRSDMMHARRKYPNATWSELKQKLLSSGEYEPFQDYTFPSARLKSLWKKHYLEAARAAYDDPWTKAWAWGGQKPTGRRASRRVRRNVTRRKNVKRRTTKKSGLPDWMNKVIYWGRHGKDAYYVQSPNLNVRLYRGVGAKDTARTLAGDLAKRYGIPLRKQDRMPKVVPNRRRVSSNPRSRQVDREIKALAGLKMSGRSADYDELVSLLRKKYGASYATGLETHAQQEVSRLKRRRMSANPRGTGASAQSKAKRALNEARRTSVRGGGGLNKSVRARLARMPAGLYRIGGGGQNPTVTKFKTASLQGAMTNTRIAASKSGDTHWLVRVYPSGSPRVLVIRKIDGKGKTAYRVEEFAEKARKSSKKTRRAA